MKYILMLVVTLYQVDAAFAGSGEYVDIQKMEDQLQKAAKLNIFMLRSLPQPVNPEAVPVAPSPLSCDIKLQSQREKVELDYNCDPIKTIKTETLAVAVN